MEISFAPVFIDSAMGMEIDLGEMEALGCKFGSADATIHYLLFLIRITVLGYFVMMSSAVFFLFFLTISTVGVQMSHYSFSPLTILVFSYSQWGQVSVMSVFLSSPMYWSLCWRFHQILFKLYSL